MPTNFDPSARVRSIDNFKRMGAFNERKTFGYSKKQSDMNFNDMYEDLNANVAQLVEQNRLKLVSMNSTRSKELVNKTQIKLISFMKSKPGNKKTFTLSSVDTSHKQNIYDRPDELKQNHQQIFDLNKLQHILKTYEQNTLKQGSRFSGALAEKVLKMTDRKNYTRPFTHRTLNTATTEASETSRNYMGWKAQKSKRRLKNLFS